MLDPPTQRAQPRTRRPTTEELVPALAFVVLAGLAALGLYLIHPVASGYRLPVGPDGPVYTWLARYASVAGFGDVPGAGPGVPALTLTLGQALRTVPVQTVLILGPVLAAAAGLAGGAVVEAAVGRNTGRTASAVALTAAFAAYLAGGWLANVALVVVFLAAAAALSRASTSWRPVILAAGLIFAGGLSHRIFVVAAVGIVLLAAVLGTRELLRPVRSDGSRADRAPVREAVAGLGGGVLAAAVLLWVGSGPALNVDTSQDGFLRRMGLRSLLLDRYRERFLGDLTRSAIPLAGGILLGGAWIAGNGTASAGERFLRRFLVAWAAVTVVGVVVLAATGAGPANRVLQFAFFLPIAAACGVAVMARRRGAVAWAAAVLVAGFVVASLFGWSRQSPAFQPGELAAGRRASAAVARLGVESPVIFLVDTGEPAASYHVTRMGNVIRAGVDPALIDDVHLAVGAPQDFVAGRPTLTGDVEHDAIATAYATELDPVREGAVTLVLPEFNPEGYEEAARMGVELVPGVVLLPVGRGSTVVGVEPTGAGAGGSTGGDGLDLLGLLTLSPAALLGLGVAGAGWARWALGPAGGRAATLAAPSVGLAVVILGSVAAERVGFLPGSLASAAIVLALAAIGYSLALSDRR